MDWAAHSSVPAEMWLLPTWFPFHPAKLWCHCRMVYLPMCYLHGRKWTHAGGGRAATAHSGTKSADAKGSGSLPAKSCVDPWVRALRRELYAEDTPFHDDYDAVTHAEWDATRSWIAPTDDYSPVSLVMRTVQALLARWEAFAPGSCAGRARDALRRRGLAFALSYMEAEDAQTNYICIGPVNKALNMLCAFAAAEDPDAACVPGDGGSASTQGAADQGPCRDAGRTDDAPDPPSRGQRRWEAFQRHVQRVPDYLWIAEDGMKVQGYNGSQCWDTCFFLQAALEGGLIDGLRPGAPGGVPPSCVARAFDFLERTQILCSDASLKSPALPYETEAGRRKWFRQLSRGGWPFSTAAHGWPISDCTAEGLKSVLATLATAGRPQGSRRCRDAGIQAGETGWADRVGLPTRVDGGGSSGNGDPASAASAGRLRAAAEVLLALQNADGGWATYENNRGYGWYESLNPSETFGDIMIDYSYVECSSACVTALAALLRTPGVFVDEGRAAANLAQPRRPRLRARCTSAVRAGGEFLRSIQRADGSWYGSWACCFTYGTWFGIEGLRAAGAAGVDEDAAVRRAVRFLLAKQNANGGWGEDFTSCYRKEYAAGGMRRWGDAQGSGVVPTAWAVLALLAAVEAEAEGEDAEAREAGGKGEAERAVWAAAERGARYLVERQRPDGDWPQEGIAGVFNRACGISYTNYRNIFPTWALGRFARLRAERS
jgi:squalene/oxidosqualene cyclase-like protein